MRACIRNGRDSGRRSRYLRAVVGCGMLAGSRMVTPVLAWAASRAETRSAIDSPMRASSVQFKKDSISTTFAEFVIALTRRTSSQSAGRSIFCVGPSARCAPSANADIACPDQTYTWPRTASGIALRAGVSRRQDLESRPRRTRCDSLSCAKRTRAITAKLEREHAAVSQRARTMRRHIARLDTHTAARISMSRRTEAANAVHALPKLTGAPISSVPAKRSTAQIAAAGFARAA